MEWRGVVLTAIFVLASPGLSFLSTNGLGCFKPSKIASSKVTKCCFALDAGSINTILSSDNPTALAAASAVCKAEGWTKRSLAFVASSWYRSSSGEKVGFAALGSKIWERRQGG